MTGESRLQRCHFPWALALLAVLLGQGSSASGEPPQSKTASKTETFDRDPQWDGKANRLVPRDPPTVNQDFGYSATTNHAGQTPGEIGGEVWRSLTPAYYGKAIAEKSFATAMSASGSLALLKAQAISGWQTGATIFVGWFNADPRDLIWRPRNFLGFRLEASNEPDGALVEVCYGTRAWQAGGVWVDAAGGGQERNVKELESGRLLRIPPDGAKHRWSLRHDPSAGDGAGELTFGFDGAETRLRLGAEHRQAGARCNRFGIFACRIPGRSMVAYFDDIALDGQMDDFSKDPGWDGAGHRARFKDTAQYAYNDFGFSPETHHAGGARAGELGGRFLSCDPDEEQFKGYYGDRIGRLTLDNSLAARGKFAANEFCIDATFALGWFNSRKQGWPIENFVGVYLDIVYNEAIAGHAFHGVGVFHDPSAPPEERYKAVYNSRVPAERVARLNSRSPGSVTPLGEAKSLLILCAASPDGIRWKPLPDPLMSQMSDTGTTMYYDQVLRRYVGYFRMSFMNRRLIGRSEGTALDAPWPAPEVVLWTDPADAPSHDYYTNGKSLYPGTKTAHVSLERRGRGPRFRLQPRGAWSSRGRSSELLLFLT